MTELDPRVERLIASLRETDYIVLEPTRSGSLTFTVENPDHGASVKVRGGEMSDAAWHKVLLQLEETVGWSPAILVEKRAAEKWKQIQHLYDTQRSADPKAYDEKYQRMREIAETEIADSRMVIEDIAVDAQFAHAALTQHQIAAEWRGVPDDIAPDIKRILSGDIEFVKQRNLSKGRATDLGASMWRGNWMLTHQGPGIAPDGYIIDGRHRLEGVLRTNGVAAMRITYQLPNKTFSVIDTGKPKTAADTLSSLGIKNPGAVSAAVRLHHFYDDYPNDLSKWYNERVTNEELRKLLLQRYLGIPDSHRLASRVCSGRESIVKCRPAVAVAHHAALRRWPQGAEAADEFWEVVRTGEVGTHSGGNHPAMRLRTWAVRWAGRTNAIGNKKGRFMIEHLQVALRCWNAFVEERDPGRMSFDARWGMAQPIRPKGTRK